jgi:hypothetical protein
MGEVLAADVDQLGIRREIIIAVGKPEPRLGDGRNIAIGVLVVLSDIDADRAANADPVGLGGDGGIVLLRGNALDLVKPRLERYQPLASIAALSRKAL